MKKIFLVLTATVFLCYANAQGQRINPVDEKKALTEKSFSLFQQGKLDDAIELAAKVVELERKSPQTDSASYVNATLNLARMSRSTFETLRPGATYTSVYVTVGENGKIVEATADATDSKLGEPAEQEVSKWFVRPFIYNGLTRKTRGYLTYPESR